MRGLKKGPRFKEVGEAHQVEGPKCGGTERFLGIEMSRVGREVLGLSVGPGRAPKRSSKAPLKGTTVQPRGKAVRTRSRTLPKMLLGAS